MTVDIAARTIREDLAREFRLRQTASPAPRATNVAFATANHLVLVAERLVDDWIKARQSLTAGRCVGPRQGFSGLPEDRLIDLGHGAGERTSDRGYRARKVMKPRSGS